MTSMSSSSGLQCQRCRLPLLPHESLSELSNAQINLLTNRNDPSKYSSKSSSSKLPVVTEDGDELEDEEDGEYDIHGTNQPVTITANVGQSPGESFVMLTESLMAGPPATNGNGTPAGPSSLFKRKKRDESDKQISQMVNKTEMLFEALTSKSDIDYPVCNECAELIREGLKAKYEESCNERDVYISFLNKLKDQPGAGSEEVEELMKEIESLEKENEQALQELKNAEKERIQVDEELERLKKESEELTKEEERFFEKQNRYALQLADYASEKDRLESIYENNATQLQKLQKVNVYNDVFCIGHDSHFGTINGLRLGRLRDKKVEWSEINAAWGQTLLLLATVIQKLDFKLVGYRLRPLGSVSRIEKLENDPKTGQPTKPVSLELYSSGDYTLERLLNHKRLDAAMVAFLTVLKQVGEHVESLDSSLKLPYVIDGDEIGGCSIKLSMNTSNESWTTACKYVLTNAKWILAYASHR